MQILHEGVSAEGCPTSRVVRRVLAESGSSTAFRLNDVTYGEGGMIEGLAQGDWERIREIAYEGRGS